MAKAITGRMLNKTWGVNARHALYHKDGTWYHMLERFPGALFDANGYVLFRTVSDFNNCSYLSITQDVNVPGGISTIPTYIRKS